MANEILQDVILSELLLDGKKLDLKAAEAITAADLNRTINGASTIDFTFHDPDKAILISGIFDEVVDLEVDDFKFELVKVDKTGMDLSVTVEDWAVAQLRKITTPMKANRAKMTRAQFAKSIVDKVDGVEFFCPELTKKQPIAKKEDVPSQSQADANKESGFAKDSGILIKNSPATPEQKKNINIVLKTGVSMGAPDWILIAAIATIIDEANANNLTGGDRDSVGIFQQRASWGTAAQRHDVAYAANSFFASAISAAATGGFPLKNSALLATKVQNPQVFSQGTNSKYYKAVDRWMAEAISIYEAWSGSTVAGGDPSVKGTKVYEFHLGGAGHLKETGWECLVRLANEVDWRCYSIGKTIYFLPDRDLFKSRPLDTLREEDDSIDTIDFSMDLGKKVDHASVTCHASRWSIPPGSVILLDNVGKANGRWLVESVSRSLFNDITTVTLVKPTPAKAEPRATSTVGGSGGNGLKHVGDFGGDIVISLARQWIGQTYKGSRSYVMGANHGLTYTQMRDGAVTPPFDCSSLARYCWAKGGHTDIGNATPQQIAKGKGSKWKQGSGAKPAGGWLPGDLLFPHAGHVNMSMGDGTMIGAHSPSIGISITPEYSTVFYWCRPEPGEDG